MQLTRWTLLTGDDTRIQSVGFDVINGIEGQLVPLDNPEGVEAYRTCLDDISSQFQYPCFYNGLLLHFFLFNTEGWDDNNLVEKSRISNIKRVTLDVIKFGCQDFTKGTDSLPALSTSLAKMLCLSSKPFVRQLIPKLLITWTVQEGNWIDNKISLFQEVYTKICPDMKYLRNFIATFTGDMKSFPNLHNQSLSLFHLRFQSILDLLSGKKKFSWNWAIS